MKQGFVKAASATPAIRVADPVYNAQVICEQMEEAVSHGAKIVVFPELCIAGYTCGDLFLQNLLLEEAKEALLRITAQTAKMDAVIKWIPHVPTFAEIAFCTNGIPSRTPASP